MDRALQKLLSQPLRQRILYTSHQPHLAAHPGKQRMYETMQKITSGQTRLKMYTTLLAIGTVLQNMECG